MKHLKSFKLFESIDNDISEVKSVFIEYAQDHDLKYVEIDMDNYQPLLTWEPDGSGGGTYNIRRNINHSAKKGWSGLKWDINQKSSGIIIEIVWPFTNFMESVDVNKYISDLDEYKLRFEKMGYQIECEKEAVSFKIILMEIDESLKESVILTDPELIEVRDVFIEFAQDHDLEFVDDVWEECEDGPNGGGFYSIRRLEDNKDYNILIDIILPFKDYKSSISVYEFIRDIQPYEDRFYHMGYENVKHLCQNPEDHTSVNFQIAM